MGSISFDDLQLRSVGTPGRYSNQPGQNKNYLLKYEVWFSANRCYYSSSIAFFILNYLIAPIPSPGVPRERWPSLCVKYFYPPGVPMEHCFPVQVISGNQIFTGCG